MRSATAGLLGAQRFGTNTRSAFRAKTSWLLEGEAESREVRQEAQRGDRRLGRTVPALHFILSSCLLGTGTVS